MISSHSGMSGAMPMERRMTWPHVPRAGDCTVPTRAGQRRHRAGSGRPCPPDRSPQGPGGHRARAGSDRFGRRRRIPAGTILPLTTDHRPLRARGPAGRPGGRRPGRVGPVRSVTRWDWSERADRKSIHELQPARLTRFPSAFARSMPPSAPTSGSASGSRTNCCSPEAPIPRRSGGSGPSMPPGSLASHWTSRALGRCERNRSLCRRPWARDGSRQRLWRPVSSGLLRARSARQPPNRRERMAYR